MFPPVKITKFTDETKNLLSELSKKVNFDQVKKAFARLHRENVFNRRFSGVLDSFSDFQTVAERLDENIERLILIERKAQKQDKIDQDLYKKADKLIRQNRTDLKNLYVNAKIFLDEYTNLLGFIFNWRGVQSRSITRFYNSLKDYSESDKDVLAFKENCLKKLKVIDVYITEYRVHEVVHNQEKHKQTTKWFINEMDGRIRFIGGGRPSLIPQEVTFVVAQYIQCSQAFCLNWLDSKL